MSDINTRVDELAEIMSEFNLSEAELKGNDWRVALRKNRPAPTAAPAVLHDGHADMDGMASETVTPEPAPAAEKPVGMPINSPMNGIFYAAPSPTAAPFVNEGDVVEAGQVVALIEAMKVFNEIVAPMAGTVQKIAAKSGDIVNQGDPLLYVS
ncbi:MAG: hypothetical protein KF784_10355 [Fimbriimonadaceae bacterium]|nr:hypothetical protein [Fimbriimonadaceae bacterium]